MILLVITEDPVLFLPEHLKQLELTNQLRYSVPDDYLKSPLLAARYREVDNVIVIENSDQSPPLLLVPDSGNSFLDLCHTANFYQMWSVPSFISFLLSSAITTSPNPIVSNLPADTPPHVIDYAFALEATNFWSACDFLRSSSSSSNNVTTNNNDSGGNKVTTNNNNKAGCHNKNNNKVNNSNLTTLLQQLSDVNIVPEVMRSAEALTISLRCDRKVSLLDQNLGTVIDNVKLGYLHPYIWHRNPERSWLSVQNLSDIKKLLYLHSEFAVPANNTVLSYATTWLGSHVADSADNGSCCYPYSEDYLLLKLQQKCSVKRFTTERLFEGSLVEPLLNSNLDLSGQDLLYYLFGSRAHIANVDIVTSSSDDISTTSTSDNVSTSDNLNNPNNDKLGLVARIMSAITPTLKSTDDSISVYVKYQAEGMIVSEFIRQSSSGKQTSNIRVKLATDITVQLSADYLIYAVTGVLPCSKMLTVEQLSYYLTNSVAVAFDPKLLPNIAADKEISMVLLRPHLGRDHLDINTIGKRLPLVPSVLQESATYETHKTLTTFSCDRLSLADIRANGRLDVGKSQAWYYSLSAEDGVNSEASFNLSSYASQILPLSTQQLSIATRLRSNFSELSEPNELTVAYNDGDIDEMFTIPVQDCLSDTADEDVVVNDHSYHRDNLFVIAYDQLTDSWDTMFGIDMLRQLL